MQVVRGVVVSTNTASMRTIRIKNVPEESDATRRAHATEANPPRQEFLKSRLTVAHDTQTLEEILDRAGSRTGGSVSLADAVAALRSDRARS